MRDQFRTVPVEGLYEIIGRSLVRCLSDGWREATLVYEWMDADVTESSAYFLDDTGTKRYVRLRPAGPELSDALMEIARKMDEAGHPRWDKAEFTMDRSGQFHLDYSYPPDGSERPARLWDSEGESETKRDA